MDSLKATSLQSSYDEELFNEENSETFRNVSGIKNWITSKLSQLEEKNQLLKEENKKVNEELMKLKERYVKKSFTPEPSRRRYQQKRYHNHNRYMFRGRTMPEDITSSSSSSSDYDQPSHRNVRNHKSNQQRNHTPKKYNNNHLSSKSSSLDRKLSKMKKYNFETNKKRLAAATTGNRHGKDYLENFITLNRCNKATTTDDGDNNLGDVASSNNKPPTPPLHRMPSWESRIYEIANNGIQSALSTPVQHSKKMDFLNFYNVVNERDDDHHHHRDHVGAETKNNNIQFVGADGGVECSSQSQQNFENLITTGPHFNNNNNHVGSDNNMIMNNNNRQSQQQQPFKSATGAATAHIKSSQTSSGNESDSTTATATITNFDEFPTTQQQLKSMYFDAQQKQQQNDMVPFQQQQHQPRHSSLDICLVGDSFEKLKITPKLFTTTTNTNGSGSSSSSTHQHRHVSTNDLILFNHGNNHPNHHHDNKLEKSGYLYKLSGKFKVWKKRWFVLKDGQLFYFKRQRKNLLTMTSDDDDNAFHNNNQIDLSAPKGKIILDQNCSLIRSNKEYTFHLFQQPQQQQDSSFSSHQTSSSWSSSKKKNVIHLRCESLQSYNEWLRAIGQTLTISNILKLQDNQVPIIENYIIKVRFGHSLKCWTALYNHHLVYFNNPFEKIPLGYTSLKDSTFQESNSVSDIEDMALIYDDIKKDIHYSLSIHPKGNSEPIYLLFMNKQDFSLWYYHLKLAFAEHNIPKTAFESLLTSLLNVESTTKSKEEFYSHEIWNNPLLTFSSETNISEPLISLYSDELKKEAFKLFKSINLFISVAIDQSAIDYHVTLVQNCLQVCIDYPELQAELYYQLIKQSSKPKLDTFALPNKASTPTHKQTNIPSRTFWCSAHSIFKCDSSSPSIDQLSQLNNDTKISSGNSFVYLQCLQFLSITISIFLPQNQVLWLLKHHINRYKDEQTQLGKYFLYCERALSRILLNGPRKRIPSRMEVLSILQRNPYQHSMPHSIPVHFANNSYQVVGFDGSTTIREFIQQINQESGIRDNVYSGFALYSDDPIETNVEHLLELNAKLADAISYWETTLRKYNPGKFENTKIIKLCYKHRLCLRKHYKNETDKERLIWIYEINNEVINNRFPVTYDLAIELMSLMMQIEYGNYKCYYGNNNNTVQQVLEQCLTLFLPSKYYDGSFNENASSRDCLIETIAQRWSELHDRSVLDCVRIYLNCTRKWNLCGAKLFLAKVYQNLKYDDLASLYLFKFFLNHTQLWLAVNEESVELLDLTTFRSILSIPYRSLLSYGYYKQYFNMTVAYDCLDELISTELITKHSSASSSTSGAHTFQPNNQNNGQRLIFTMDESKTIQITTLISDYIEIKKQQQQLNQ